MKQETKQRLEQIRKRLDNLGFRADPDLEFLAKEVERLDGILNKPEFYDFIKAIPLEAAHQLERWGKQSDEGKEPQDWFWLIGYLSGKALRSHLEGDTEKALHHCISSSAALANWHAAILGTSNMRPGIDKPL